MSSPPHRGREDLLRGLILYFRPDILGVFQSRTDKYRLETDEFSGHVEIRDAHPDRLSVDFGFRACQNGEWAIAAFRPDVERASASEQRQWSGFQLGESDVAAPPDARFNRWVERYIDGSWEVEDGPIARLDHIIAQINAITECAIGLPLFTATDIRGLCFPVAENNHRYHDAHSEAYKLLQDSLSKGAIDLLGRKLGIIVKSGDKWTVTALMQLLPEALRADVQGPLDVVAQQRRLAGHKQRPAPVAFPAFETFGKDMEAVVRAIEILRNALAERLNLDVEGCEAHSQAIKHLPTLDPARPAKATYGIFSARHLQGRQVIGVRAGYCTARPGRPDGEGLILEMSDGSLFGIEAVTNIGQLIEDGGTINPEALHVALDVTYVPPLRPYRPDVGPDSAGDSSTIPVDQDTSS